MVIEQTDTGYGAHIPSIPGCVAVGSTEEEAKRLLGEALVSHLVGELDDVAERFSGFVCKDLFLLPSTNEVAAALTKAKGALVNLQLSLYTIKAMA